MLPYYNIRKLVEKLYTGLFYVFNINLDNN